MKTVLIPDENVKDLAEISDEVKEKLEIIPVARVDEVLKNALVRMPERIEWDEAAEAAAAATATNTEPSDDDRPLAH